LPFSPSITFEHIYGNKISPTKVRLIIVINSRRILS